MQGSLRARLPNLAAETGMQQNNDGTADISDQRILRLQTVCLMILSLAAVIHLLVNLRSVLVPFIVAVFIVSGVSPILERLQRHLHVSRIVAAAIAFSVGASLSVLFGISVWLSVAELQGRSDEYLQGVRSLTGRIEPFIPAAILDAATEIPAAANGREAGSGIPGVQSMIRSGIAQVSQVLGEVLSSGTVVLIFVFFLLLGAPQKQLRNHTLRQFDQQVKSYLSLKTIISIFTGLAFGLALRLFGVPMALTFGVLAFLMNFIPNIGPVIASALPLPLILLDPNASATWMCCVIITIFAIQLISGNLLEPRIMGESANLHPVTILLALMFWGTIWGIVGMFLATPVTAVIRIGLERIPFTRSLAMLMAGQIPED